MLFFTCLRKTKIIDKFVIFIKKHQKNEVDFFIFIIIMNFNKKKSFFCPSMGDFAEKSKIHYYNKYENIIILYSKIKYSFSLYLKVFLGIELILKNYIHYKNIKR